MRTIGESRHSSGLRKELSFWRRHDPTRLSQMQQGRFQHYLQPFLDENPIDPRGSVLDVGCGPTCLAQHIPCEEKWYLDPLLEAYRQTFGPAIPEGVHLSCPLEEADLPEDHFDLVIAINALDHFRDPWDALRRMRIALKPDGFLLLSLYVRAPWLSTLHNLQEAFYLSTDRAHPHSFTRRRLELDLLDTGLCFSQPREVDTGGDRNELLWVCRRTAG